MAERIYKCSEVKESCKYSCGISSRSSSDLIICDYIVKTGRRRGCDPEKCDKYKKRG